MKKFNELKKSIIANEKVAIGLAYAESALIGGLAGSTIGRGFATMYRKSNTPTKKTMTTLGHFATLAVSAGIVYKMGEVNTTRLLTESMNARTELNSEE